MASISRTYLSHLTDILNGIVDKDRAALECARDHVATALKSDRLVYVAGSGHSHLIAAEAFFRAGGIAAVQPIFDPSLMLHVNASRSSLIERESGHAARVLAGYGIDHGDVVFIVSNSGRNAFPIEAAMIAKQRGAKTVAVTSIEHSKSVSSRHSSGKRLFEVTDIVIDNGAPYGDACLEIGPANVAMGPTSTISGSFIINAVIAEAVDSLARQGIAVDVYPSSNGEDAGAAVDAIVERWKPRIKGL